MLIVAGTFTVDPTDVEKFQDAAKAMMTATLQEPACHQYVFSVSMANQGQVQIFEIWETLADLEAHFEMAHMATFRESLGSLDILSRDVNRYEIASSAPL